MAVTEIASLSDVKTYLRIPNPTLAMSDDAILLDMMDAARRVVERELGHIVSKTISAERHDGGSCQITLRELPVLYVQQVEEGWNYYNWQLSNNTVNTQPSTSIWVYSVDIPQEGVVTRRGPGNVPFPFVRGLNNIRVDYVVGREYVPATAMIAFKELVSYWYRNSQLRAVNQGFTTSAAQGAFGTLNTDMVRSTGESGLYTGVPEGILALLRPDRRRPIIG